MSYRIITRSIEEFKVRRAFLMKSGYDFEILTRGGEKRIIFPNGIEEKFRGNGSPQENKLSGRHLIGQLRSQIDKYILTNNVPISQPTTEQQMWNVDLIKKNVGKRVKAVDINSCYWFLAHSLGFMDEKCFQKAIENRKEWKRSMLYSVGCLNRRDAIETIEEGKRVKTEVNTDFLERYSPFYWSIIQEARSIMYETFEAIGADHWYMWITDCVVFDPEYLLIVRKLFNIRDLEYKEFDIDIIGVEDNKVKWFDHSKNVEKSMSIGKRDINLGLLAKQLN